MGSDLVNLAEVLEPLISSLFLTYQQPLAFEVPEMVIFYSFFFHIFILGYRNVDQAVGFCLICVEPWVGHWLLPRTSALIPALGSGVWRSKVYVISTNQAQQARLESQFCFSQLCTFENIHQML